MGGNFKEYRKKQTQLLRPYEPGEDVSSISISSPDTNAGSPKLGDMIAVNPLDDDDKWLVSKKFFEDNYELVTEQK